MARRGNAGLCRAMQGEAGFIGLEEVAVRPGKAGRGAARQGKVINVVI